MAISDIIDFAQRIDAMSEEDREHFKDVINSLSFCYGDTGIKALVLIDHPNGRVDTISVGCDDMEAYQIASATKQYFEFINTVDAPPRERFN